MKKPARKDRRKARFLKVGLREAARRFVFKEIDLTPAERRIFAFPKAKIKEEGEKN